MKSELPKSVVFKGFSIPEILIGVAVVGVIGCVSFMVSLSIKKSIVRSFSTPEAIEVSLAPPADPEPEAESPESSEGGSGIWRYASSAQSEEQFLSEVFSTPGSPSLILATPAYSSQPKPLNNPVFSKQPGSFPKSDFPLILKISNPNDRESTWTMLSVNGSQFSRFEDGALLVQPNDKVQAYVRGDTREWNESGIVSGQYTVAAEGARHFRAPVRRIKFGPQ